MTGMSGPGWLADLFAGVMILVAVYSAGRLVIAHLRSRLTHVDVDLAHVMMGAAMAGMLVSAINLLPAHVWEGVFTVLALWFLWRCHEFVAQHGFKGQDDDHVHHLSHYATHEVMALAMLYMYLAAAPRSNLSANGSMPTGPTGTAADFVGLPLLFLVVLLSSGIWELDGIERFSPTRARRIPELALTSVASTAPLASASTAPLASGEALQASSPLEEGQTLGRRSERPQWLAPRLEAACHIAMCITMGYMLIVML
jgi:hypothetical protein